MADDLAAFAAAASRARARRDRRAHDAVPALAERDDVLCAPSQTTAGWREQFGRMLIEAMACGVPVVASDSGEIPPSSASRRGRRRAGRGGVGGRDRSAARRRGGAAHAAPRGLERAHARFAWPVVARAHLAFFESCVTRKRVTDRQCPRTASRRCRRHRRLRRRAMAEHGSRRRHAVSHLQRSTRTTIDGDADPPADAAPAAVCRERRHEFVQGSTGHQRFFDYPRVLAALDASFDVYHVVDHSYAHLLHGLPAGRTLVTCHDLDTFRIDPRSRTRSGARCRSAG